MRRWNAPRKTKRSTGRSVFLPNPEGSLVDAQPLLLPACIEVNIASVPIEVGAAALTSLFQINVSSHGQQEASSKLCVHPSTGQRAPTHEAPLSMTGTA
jgi:hypothetical protein